MTRTKAILSAAGITSIVLMTIVAINAINLIADGTIVINLPVTDHQAQLDELSTRQEALDQVEGVMTDRQTDYAAQIEAAQNHIVELEAAIEAQRKANASDAAAISDLAAQAAAANNTAAQLESEAQAWQQKEAGYAAQINAANDQIRALQSQID